MARRQPISDAAIRAAEDPVACPHIECVACGKVEHQERLRSVWAEVEVVTWGDGSRTVERGRVCSARCFESWAKSMARRLPFTRPKRGRPPA